ncbi:MAG: hypothetical protein K6G47_05975 [Clostridia bacterium]|nr:hypothetical protein [Clostridia bacterium]
MKKTINTQKRSSMKDFFNKPVTRALVNGIIDLILAVYTAVIPRWTGVAWCILAIIIMIDLFVIIYYGVQTINYRASISKLQETNEQLKRCCDNSNGLIKNISSSCENTNEQLSSSSWNYEVACKEGMKMIHKMIKDYMEHFGSDEPNVEVIYDQVSVDKENNSRKVKTTACSTDESSDPHICGMVRNVDTDNYLDSEYIRDGNYEIRCITDYDEVQAKLQNRTQIGRKNHEVSKYNQLFFIPVLWQKKKLIGLLVIACLQDTSLARTDKEAEAYIRNTIEPYLKLLTFFYKLENMLGL